MDVGIIAWLIFGGIAGWIASMIMGTDAQQGLLMNIIVGIVGALIGGFVASLLGFGSESFAFFDIGSWITAILGAVILLFLVKTVMGRGRRV